MPASRCCSKASRKPRPRIYIEQELAKGKLPVDVATLAREALKANLQETMFIQGNSAIHAFEEYTYRWQDRSTRLYQTAAAVAKAQRM